MDYQNQRNKLVDWTKGQLMGDKQKTDFILDGEKPLDRFFTGFLFPIFDDNSDDLGFDNDSDDDNREEGKRIGNSMAFFNL